MDYYSQFDMCSYPELEQDPLSSSFCPATSDRPVFKCTHPHCGVEFKQKTYLKQHLQQFHQPQEFWRNSPEGRQKKKECGSSSGSQCVLPGCQAICSTRVLLFRHIRQVHKMKPVDVPGLCIRDKNRNNRRGFKCMFVGCPGVNQDFGTVEELQKHLRGSGHEEVPSLCPFANCATRRSSIYTLRAHLRNDHQTDPKSIDTYCFRNAWHKDQGPPPVAEMEGWQGQVSEGTSRDSGEQSGYHFNYASAEESDEEQPIEMGNCGPISSGTGKRAVLCALCCFSFYPEPNHVESLKENVQWGQLVQQVLPDNHKLVDNPGKVFQKVGNLSVCPDCVAAVERTMDQRKDVEVVEGRVRMLQRQLLEEMRLLEGKVEQYAGGMAQLKKVVREADVTCLEAQLENNGRNNGGSLIVGLRNGIVEAADKLSGFRNELTEKFGGQPPKIPGSLPRKKNRLEGQMTAAAASVLFSDPLQDPGPVISQVFSDTSANNGWTPFKIKVHAETLKRLERLQLPQYCSPESKIGIPDPRPNYCMEYNQLLDSFQVGPVPVILHEMDQTLECGSCSYPARDVGSDKLVTTVMQEHIQKKHLFIYQCQTCGQDPGSWKQYVEHVKGHLPRLACSHCQKVHYSEEALAAHWLAVHGGAQSLERVVVAKEEPVGLEMDDLVEFEGIENM